MTNTIPREMAINSKDFIFYFLPMNRKGDCTTKSPYVEIGADDGNRTRVAGLGSRNSTIEPHPPDIHIIQHFSFFCNTTPAGLFSGRQTAVIFYFITRAITLAALTHFSSEIEATDNRIPFAKGTMEKDSQIGLISPFSNNSANTSLPMFEGFGFTQMNELLEKKFLGEN